jgi:hypothetical protein
MQASQLKPRPKSGAVWRDTDVLDATTTYAKDAIFLMPEQKDALY